MYVASVTAYLLGSLSDIWLFGIIKKATKGKFLWLRATGSTVISQVSVIELCHYCCSNHLMLLMHITQIYISPRVLITISHFSISMTYFTFPLSTTLFHLIPYYLKYFHVLQFDIVYNTFSLYDACYHIVLMLPYYILYQHIDIIFYDILSFMLNGLLYTPFVYICCYCHQLTVCDV